MKQLAPSSSLPDHLWLKIFEIGIHKSKFDIRDLSSLAISCKNFNKLSQEDSLWSPLLTLDFPPRPQTDDPVPSPKALYKFALHCKLKHKRGSLEQQVAEDELELGTVTKLIKKARLSVGDTKSEIEESSAELQELMTQRIQTRSIRKDGIALKERHASLIEQVGKIEELWGLLADIIDPRESNVDRGAVHSQSSLAFAAPTDSHSLNGPSSSTPAGPSPFADAFIRLEMAIHELSSDRQEDFRIQQHLVPPIVDGLLQRWREHRQQLDVLTRRLVPFSTGSHPVEIINEDEVAIKAAEADGGSDLEAA